MKNRYLTKSRFKLAMECPRKLFYTGKKEYVNKQVEDSFLQALAEGGFQVGELAKLYHPDGHDIRTLDYQLALEETNKLLKQDKCTIYEAAIKYQDFFIRVDILVKEGNKIEIIEVKSKSVDLDPNESHLKKEKTFLTKKRIISADWKPYLYDIAFQNYVARQALKQYEVVPYLMLVDKDATCPTDGLNQKFKISRDSSGRKYSVVSNQISQEDLAEKLLVKIDVRDSCQRIYEANYDYIENSLGFNKLIEKFAYQYREDLSIFPRISSSCKNCEFKASEKEMEVGLKSGYHECFKNKLEWTDEDFKETTVFELWDNKNIQKHLDNNILKLSQLKKEDIESKTSKKNELKEGKKEEIGLSRVERQWLQIEKYKNKDTSAYVDKEGLEREINSWVFPYHFIDFETAMPAIPFNKGRKPYEGIAFQFSHHLIQEDGTIEHKGQYLNTNPGEFPNYEFLRQLKAELDVDQGSIFRYASHENTYLNMIYEQLAMERDQVEDGEELLEFIADITQPPSDKKKWKTMARPSHIGKRNMIDMLELVKRYYYEPHMKGSNSIKVVLPSILNSSAYIREKYSQPIYGIDKEIKSLNFPEKIWVEYKDGKVKDPYELLPDIFEDLDPVSYDLIDREDKINDGGAAMTAYERLQFENIPSNVREKIAEGLLKYCELDTLAMVMIYEAWKDILEL